MRTVAALTVLLLAIMSVWADCTCAQAKKHGGWCDACGVGYVGSVEISSRLLYEELDAHGHPMNPATVKCEACREAIAENGSCDRHKRGFVNGEAYLTPLAYHLARGTHVEPSTLDCPVCLKNSETHGWCDNCRRGMVGHVAIDVREDYDKVAVEYEVLIEANRKAATCETCAVAMVLDGICPHCGLVYEDGRPQPLEKP
jgi:hypothetical protein